ncbi:mechanosensitive ion channel family protein [Marinibaculum pumilum]|uniref:Small-conductance mechanosensitive channel n=1 Tax=Marinibaculum pumilum TaxID=1766165 RepID=A0ABV7KZX4_9PROT
MNWNDILAGIHQRILGHLTDLLAASPRILGALAVVALTGLIAWGARRLIERAGGGLRFRTALVEVAGMLAAALIWVLGLLVAATIAFPSVTPADVLTALGLGSIAIGFAFKDIFENFFAGILILLREPFKLGDHVECQEIEGAVERISVRDTHVRQTDGQLVVVPNAKLFQNPVRVRTNLTFRRVKIICGVAYGEDADRARDVIHDAVIAVDSVRDDIRDVQVFAHGFGASSIDFEIAWWTGSRPVDIRASRDEVVRAVKRALDAAGIEIPFPQRTVWMRREEAEREEAERKEAEREEAEDRVTEPDRP